MASKTKTSKRDAILDAMLEVVVERGFHEAPMSLIAERSGTSAGLIYHHFASKEEIIQALYERIHTLKMASFLAAVHKGLPRVHLCGESIEEASETGNAWAAAASDIARKQREGFHWKLFWLGCAERSGRTSAARPIWNAKFRRL